MTTPKARAQLNNAPADTPRAGGARITLIALMALALSACVSTGRAPAPSGGPDPAWSPNAPTGPTEPVGPEISVMTPPHVEGQANLVRAALLLPFSAPSSGARAEALSMLNAAEMALFAERADHVILVPKDTRGTPEGARAAAETALLEGADVVLGPLFSASVPPVSTMARQSGASVIAFTNDRSVAAENTLVLGLTPEDEIDRIVSYAADQIVQLKQDQEGSAAVSSYTFDAYSPFTPISSVTASFATLTPNNAYGWRIRDGLEASATTHGGQLATWEFFPPDASADLLTEPARMLARFAEREAAQESGAEFELPYDAVLIPEGGTKLLSLAPLLPYYDVDPSVTRFLGTSLWFDESVAREPALQGGWFPSPDPQKSAAFAAEYRRAYGDEPGRLATIAYDAVALTSRLTRIQGKYGLRMDNLRREEGFPGIVGQFRFRADGSAERALAILEIQGGQFVVREPAPLDFAPVLGF